MFLKQSWVLYLVIKEDMNQEEKITYGLNRWFWSLMEDGDLGGLIAAFQCLKGAYRNDGKRHFTGTCSGRTRDNSCKLKEGRLRLDVRKKCFRVRVVRHWSRLPRAGVGASSLKCSRAGWVGL